MSSHSIRQLLIAGAGQMGQGIAQVVSSAGGNVFLYDLHESALQSAVEKIRWSLEKLHSKQRISETPDAILSRLQTTNDLAAAASVEMVIEAVPEREDLKRELFDHLDRLCPPETLFVSNTSAIPISALAAATTRADRFCGLHFFNPVPLMPLVEVVRGAATSDETLAQVIAFSEQIGKQPVLVRQDRAGFIVNRILGAAMIEAIRLLESGLADASDIDKAMRLGCGWKMGPLETADLAGLDVVMQMCDVIQKNNTDSVFEPPALLRELVAAGKLGRKSGGGFQEYGPDPKSGTV